MRRRLCDTLHGRPSQLLIALPAAVIDRWPTVRPESRFVPPPTAFDVPVREGGGPRRNIATTFGVENQNGLPTRYSF